jgi:hypothetical protein
LVQNRKIRNLAETKPEVTRHQFWLRMAAMRLTSVQKSGLNSHVARFIRTVPFPLSYDSLHAAKKRETSITQALTQAGGIRFAPTIASQLAVNFSYLEEGEWTRALRECNRLTRPVSREVEKEVAYYIKRQFEGFGPKQSRNFLQSLGLTRYEVPIDSRVTDWLNEFGFPIRLSAAALADSNYYDLVSDGIQALCAKSGVFPCILDAVVFALKDGDAWTEANVNY